MPGTNGSALWLGIHFLPDKNNASAVDCIWSDKTNCDFGLYTSEDDPNRQNYPWLALGPPLLNDTNGGM